MAQINERDECLWVRDAEFRAYRYGTKEDPEKVRCKQDGYVCKPCSERGPLDS